MCGAVGEWIDRCVSHNGLSTRWGVEECSSIVVLDRSIDMRRSTYASAFFV